MEDKVDGEDVTFVVVTAAEDTGTEIEALVADVEDLLNETEEAGGKELDTAMEEVGSEELVKDMVREELVETGLSDARDNTVCGGTTTVPVGSVDAEDVALTDS